MPGLLAPSKSELAIAAFDDLTTNAAQAQESLLLSILQDNASCEYLRQFGDFNHSTGTGAGKAAAISTTFRELVPLVTHADIKPYLHRIADGERSSILTAAPLQALCLSSGTTEAKEKYLPYHDGLKDGTLEIARIAAAFRDRTYPIKKKDARIVEFLFCGRLNNTRGGLKVGTATTHMIRSNIFKQRQSNNGFKSCSPHSVILGSDCRQVMYCHLLCSLLYSPSVEVLSAPFAYTLVEVLRTLESEWDSLCHDLRTGTLNSHKVTDATLRAAVEEILTPNPRLATELFSNFRALARDGWRGVIEVLWPRCKYVLSILTGAMEAYVDKLTHYAGERIPLVSADYAATEGWIGVNVEPKSSSPSSVSFTVVPSLAFFEFIPLRRSQDVGPTSSGSTAYEEGHPVGLTDVKVGQEYEIVMTTRWGLYRYRLGDVLRVTGFYNSTPQVAYICRKNVLLSINIDKNTEKDLNAVVSIAAKRLAEVSGQAMQLVDYTSYADRRIAPGHYVIFWEVDVCKETRGCPDEYGNDGHSFVSKQQLQMWLVECATLMDRAFVEPGYVTSRKMNTIGALELCLVQRGTFAKLLDQFMSRGATITQYKTPRCVVSPDALSILCESACTTFHSAATFQ